MPREVGHIAPLLQIPDLDGGILGACAEDQTVGVELRRGQGRRVGCVRNLDTHRDINIFFYLVDTIKYVANA